MRISGNAVNRALLPIDRRSIVILAICLVVGCYSPPADGPSEEPGDNGSSTMAEPQLKCEGAWARPGRGAAKTGAVFLVIKNSGQGADRLIRAESTVAETVELHESYADQGMMRMRRVDGTDVPAGGTLELKPGGLHIMLIGMTAGLEPGASFQVDLFFEKSGKQSIDVESREQ